MATYTTLTEALKAHCSQGQGIIHVKTDGRRQVVPYRELYTRALGILHILQRQQLAPGDACLLYLSDTAQFLDAFWACLLGGIVPVPLAVGSGDAHRFRLLSILKTLRRPFLYTTQKHWPGCRLPNGRVCRRVRRLAEAGCSPTA
jgi:acyl-CoA synthetase (AMP-forming)/AMP-acid ligase II